MYQIGIRLVLLLSALLWGNKAAQGTNDEPPLHKDGTEVTVLVNNAPVKVALPLAPSKLNIGAPAEMTWPLSRDLTARILLETGDIRWLSRFQQASRGYWYAAQDAWPLILNTETRALQSLIDQTTYPEIQSNDSPLLDCFFRTPALAKAFYQHFGSLSRARATNALYNFFNVDYAFANNWVFESLMEKRDHPQIRQIPEEVYKTLRRGGTYEYIYRSFGLWSLTLKHLRLCVVPTSLFAFNTHCLNKNLSENPEVREKLLRLTILQSNLRWVPPEIASLQQLAYLNLNGNELRTLPDEIRALTNLKKLELQDNHFKEIPRGVVALMPTLEQLDMSRNPLETLPLEQIHNLPALTLKLSLGKTLQPNHSSILETVMPEVSVFLLCPLEAEGGVSTQNPLPEEEIW